MNDHPQAGGSEPPYASDAMQSRLEDVKAQATARYSVKDYEAAAELYSQASELQDQLNGEMSPLNADLLYAYGRCLYHLAVKKSDLLGTKLPGPEPEGSSSAKEKKNNQGQVKAEQADNVQRTNEEIVSEIVQEKESNHEPQAKEKGFVFKGDENFEDDDDDENGADEEEEEPEDDFANAYEILDITRVLLTKRLKTEQQSDGKGKSSTEPEAVRILKERLADTHDLQAEISLEGERFPQAVDDLRDALNLKLALFPQESSLLAEAHYKLSLALEFASVTQEKDDQGEVKAGTSGVVDEAMREDAAKQMELAIASCRSRIMKEEAILGTSEQKASRSDIDDVKGMVKEMEDRLIDLRQPPISTGDPRGTGALNGADPSSGILGSLLGESSVEVKARLEAASNEAKDVSGLVKKKSTMDNKDASQIVGHKRKGEVEDTVDAIDGNKKAKTLDDAKT